MKATTSKALLALLIGTAVVAACSPAPSSMGGLPVMQVVAENQATAIMITAEAVGTRTAVAAQTAVAEGMAQATAGAMAAAEAAVVLRITEEAGVLSLQSTAVALQNEVNAQSWSLTATPEAAARAAAAEMTILDLEVRDKELEQRAREAEIARKEQATRLIPWLVTAVGLFVAAVFLFRAALKWKRTVPIPVGDRYAFWGDNGVPMLTPGPRRLPTPEGMTVTGPDTAVPLPVIRTGFIIIAGRQHAGKTTAAKLLARQRADVVVIDPHGNSVPNKWGNLPVIGSGRNWDEIRAFMGKMMDMLDERFQLLESDDETEETLQARPRTVIIDEALACHKNVGQPFDEAWQTWIREGRKVGLYLIMLSQSFRVQSLGVEGEGDLIQSFDYALALKNAAVEMYPRLVQGMEWPAVLVSDGNPQPVIIPYQETEQPSSSSGPVVVPPPQINLPPPKMNPDPYGLPEEVILDIVRRARNGESRNAIQNAYWDYRGGDAFHVIRQIFVAANLLEPGDDEELRRAMRFRPLLEGATEGATEALP